MIKYSDFLLVIVIYCYNYSKINFDIFTEISLSLGIFSLILWGLARYQLGKYFSVLPKARGLITAGLYSKFTNPIYVFSSLALLFAVLPSKNIWQYLIVVIIIFIQMIRSQKESRLLKEKFGQKYLNYKIKTWF